jgi:hypothetical protein
MPASAAYSQRLLDLEETHSPEIGNAINMALELPAPACSSQILLSCNWRDGHRAPAQTSLSTATSSTDASRLGLHWTELQRQRHYRAGGTRK